MIPLIISFHGLNFLCKTILIIKIELPHWPVGLNLCSHHEDSNYNQGQISSGIILFPG